MAVAESVPKLFTYDGRRVTGEDFRTPFDAGPGLPYPVEYGDRSPLSYQYPLAANKTFTPRTEQGLPQYALLRKIAARFDLLSIIIFCQLKKISALRLGFKPREKGISPAAKAALSDQVAKAEEFWAEPDKKNRISWRGWVMSIMNEVFVTDGVRLHREETYAGDPSLRQIIPEMMKPLLDNEGDVCGWQQIIRGIPRMTYDIDEIIAPPFAPQVDGAYGKSHLECLMTTVDIGIQKLLLELAQFTESNVPRGFLFMPPEWEMPQIEAYTRFLKREYGGDLAHRTRFMNIVGTSKGYQPVNEAGFDKTHEEVLISRLCALFGEPRSVFVDSQTRGGSAATQDNVKDTGLNANLAYLLNDLVNPFTWRSVEDGGLGLTEVEGTFIDESTRDSLRVAQERQIYLDEKVLFPTEVRDDLGYHGASPAEVEAKKAEDDAAKAAENAKKGLGPNGLPLPPVVRPGAVSGQKPPSPAAVPGAPPANAENLAKEERGQWRRKAAHAFQKSGSAAVPFDAKWITPFEQWAIKRQLARAKTVEQIAKSLASPRKRLTVAKRAAYRNDIMRAAHAYLLSLLQRAHRDMPHHVMNKDVHRDAFMTFSDTLRSILRSLWLDSAADAADVANAGFSLEHFDNGAEEYARTQAAELIREVDRETRRGVRELTARAVREGMSPDEVAAELEDSYLFSGSRAETIARTEVAVAQNRGQLALLGELDIEKVLVHDGDSDDECEEADGQIWDIEEAEENPTAHPNCVRAFSPIDRTDPEFAEGE